MRRLSPLRFREEQVLPVAMFFGSFSWSFVYISLPFHIQRISTYATLALIGLACMPLARAAAPRRAYPQGGHK